MKMLKTRRQWILSGAVLLLILAVVYGAWSASGHNNKYKGLALNSEVALDDGMRNLIESQIKVSQAALEAQLKSGQKVDLNLYTSIAWDATMLGDLVLARETYEAYFEKNTLNYTAWNNYANVLKDMGDFDRAESAYKEAYTLYGNEAYYRDYIEFIDNHSVDGNRDEEINQVLEDAVSEIGQTPYFMIKLASLYEKRGDCEQMNAHYNVAKTLLPDNKELPEEIATANKNCAEVN